MIAKRIFKHLVPLKWRRKIRELMVPMSVVHLHGPKKIRLQPNEGVVTCVVRNGEFYIERFIRHYFKMGFRHLIFLDNGSTDATISIAKGHKNVSIYTTTLSIEAHQGFLKRHLARISAEGGWCLDADIDEFFDYPLSDELAFPQFLEYLNRNNYTVVVTQMLDMFSDRPISTSPQSKPEDLGEGLDKLYPFYDLSDVTKTDYATSELVIAHAGGNTVSHSAATLCWGGIRKTLSGNEYLLTKHSLFSLQSKLNLFPHVHFVNNARLADVSGVLLHYKLTSSALAIALQNQEKFPGNKKLYADFIEFVTRNSTYQVKRETAARLRRTSELVEREFLFMSEKYRQVVRPTAKSEVAGSLHYKGLHQ